MLTYLRFAERNKTSHKLNWYKCSCGREIKILQNSVVAGRQQSCGCLRGNKRHGHPPQGIKSATYNSWATMKQRCLDSKHTAWNNYGGRGIKVCSRWQDFRAFLEDMGERPNGKTLDRVNNDDNYTPENCRWATWREQQSNRRKRRTVCP